MGKPIIKKPIIGYCFAFDEQVELYLIFQKEMKFIQREFSLNEVLPRDQWQWEQLLDISALLLQLEDTISRKPKTAIKMLEKISQKKKGYIDYCFSIPVFKKKLSTVDEESELEQEEELEQQD